MGPRRRAPKWSLLLLLVLGSCVSCSALAEPTAKRSYFFPLEVRPGKVRARGLLRSGTLSVHGAVREGYFYTRLAIGTPARKFTVIIDTGSTITYVPCVNCRHCGKHQDAYFDPAASSTSKQVLCGTKECFCGWPACLCNQGKCYYERRYAEQSSSEGWLYRDRYNFPDNSTAPLDFTFGCEAGETGAIYQQEADGILGMGNNVNAFHSQLAATGQVDHVFSLCFGFPSGGGMLLGDVALPGTKLSYTPLLSDRHLHYFNIEVTGLEVAGHNLGLDPRQFKQGYGSVLDSGTTFTYLPSAAFRAVYSAVEKALLRHPTVVRRPAPDPSLNDICWRGAPRAFEALSGIFPDMKMYLGGGAVLLLVPYRYLFNIGPGEYCLGLFDNGDQGTLVGGVSVRNVLVQYDLRNKRVGFAEANCPAIGIAADAAAATPPATAPVSPAPQSPQVPVTVSPSPAPLPSPSPPQPPAPQQAPSSSPTAAQRPPQPGTQAGPGPGQPQGPAPGPASKAPSAKEGPSAAPQPSGQPGKGASPSSPTAAAGGQHISDTTKQSPEPTTAKPAEQAAAAEAAKAGGPGAEGPQQEQGRPIGGWLMPLLAALVIVSLTGSAFALYLRSGRPGPGDTPNGGAFTSWVGRTLMRSSFQPVPTSDDCELAEVPLQRQQQQQQQQQVDAANGRHSPDHRLPSQAKRPEHTPSQAAATAASEQRRRLLPAGADSSQHSGSSGASTPSSRGSGSPRKLVLPTSTSSRS